MTRPPELDPEDAEYVLDVSLALRDASELAGRALDGSVPAEELLAQAREIAVLDRLTIVELQGSEGELAERIPEPLRPFDALAALRRIGYVLVALAQDPPDPVVPEQLIDDDVAEWLELRLEDAKAAGRA